MLIRARFMNVLVIGLSLPVCTAGCGGIANQEGNRLFMQRLGRTSVTVFPAAVRRGATMSHDRHAATTIGAALSDASIAEVTVSDERVSIKGPWRMNQAKMLRESAADFAAHVREHPIETDYALLSEYLIGGGGVGGVHCYILDADGTVVWAGLWNSHHEAFTEANLRTPDDCAAMLAKVLRSEFGGTRQGE